MHEEPDESDESESDDEDDDEDVSSGVGGRRRGCAGKKGSYSSSHEELIAKTSGKSHRY